jgi:dTDP-4-dehydrorhamnose 3,5-epimerase-like enzyme
MAERVNTTITGLDVTLGKVIGDSRGWLGELLPGGSANPNVASGFGNLYVSVATGKFTARAGHYHYRQSEVFFPLTGTVLWGFRDYRENSPTFGVACAAVFSEAAGVSGPGPTYQIGAATVPGIIVPSGVYHVYWTLSEGAARVVCFASTPYDDTDYVRLDPRDVPGLKALVSPYGIGFP